MAVVPVAHRLSTVVDADTIVVLEHGRVRVSTHAQLLVSDALYRELVEALRIADAPAEARDGVVDAPDAPDAPTSGTPADAAAGPA